MLNRYKTTIPTRPLSELTWRDLRTLDDWRSDWDPLAWPAPFWAFSPHMVFLAPIDLALCLVGSLQRRFFETLDRWP